MAEDSLSGLGKVNPSKVDFNYAITDLSEVSYIEIGNEIRQFAAQKAPYFTMVNEICKYDKKERQKKMASKFRPDLNYYCLSPEFDYKQAVYLLSYPGKQRMKVHSMDIEATRDALIEEALRLQQKIIQAGDLEVEGAADNTFKTSINASVFGIGPKAGLGKIVIDTGNPKEFIKSLVALFKLTRTSEIANTTPILIKKYLPKFMQKLD